MQVVSRDVIRLLSQLRVIFQITALERSDIHDCSRSLHCLPLVVLRHVTAQGNRLVTAISKSRATYKLSQSIGGGTCFGAVAVEGFC